MPDPDALEAMLATPNWFPHALDPAADRLTLLQMEELDYRAASFLDQRILNPGSTTREVAWEQVASAVPADARRDVQFIFHIGNVGSTLISRLLGELDSVFALREPLLLRTFAEMLPRWPDGEARIGTLRALLSRTFSPGQRTIVKATSFTSEIASRMVPEGSRALFLFAQPQAYIENILAGDNSRQTADILAPARQERLRSRCPGLELDLRQMRAGRKAALGWICEMSSLEQNAAALPAGTVMWLDFDRFLADPSRRFGAIAAHFEHAVEESQARQIAEGPLMRRYSKAPQYEYSPQLRRDILAEARLTHGPAIRDALGWLNALGRSYPAAAEAIRRARKEA